MARIVWKVDALINLKLRVNLFTVGQLMHSPYLQLFDIHNSDGCWNELDLNTIEPLFCVSIGRGVLQKLAVSKLNGKRFFPRKVDVETVWIKPNLNFDGGFPFKGGRLIEVSSDDYDTVHAPVIKDDLQLPEDLEIIKKYELTNMWSDRNLAERLIRYFDTGINKDSFKENVFPGLETYLT